MTKIPDNEQAVIGGIMLDDEAIREVADQLRPENFAEKAHAVIYEATLSLHREDKRIDPATVASKLRESKQLKAAGGEEYLANCLHAVPTSAHVKTYAENVLAASKRRQLQEVAKRIIATAKSGKDANESLDLAWKEIEALEASFGGSLQFQAPFDFEVAAAEQKKQGETMSFGFDKIDKLTGGLSAGSFNVVAAETSHGKTTFSINVAKNLIEAGETVVYASYEEGQLKVLKKFLRTYAGRVEKTDLTAAITGRKLPQGLPPSLIEARKTLEKTIKDGRLIITGDNFKVGQLAQNIRILAKKLKRPPVVFIDYIGLMPVAAKSAHYLGIKQNIVELMALAQKTGATIIAAAQRNRKEDVKLIDTIREAADIAFAAEVVLILELSNYEAKDGIKKMSCHVVKAREGETTGDNNPIRLALDGWGCRIFSDTTDCKSAKNTGNKPKSGTEQTEHRNRFRLYDR